MAYEISYDGSETDLLDVYLSLVAARGGWVCEITFADEVGTRDVRPDAFTGGAELNGDYVPRSVVNGWVTLAPWDEERDEPDDSRPIEVPVGDIIVVRVR